MHSEFADQFSPAMAYLFPREKLSHNFWGVLEIPTCLRNRLDLRANELANKLPAD